jgi:hypothetical protein
MKKRAEHIVIFTEETKSCIEQARLYSEEAASFQQLQSSTVN